MARGEQRWLVAVFADQDRALATARASCRDGVTDTRAMRLGSSFDARSDSSGTTLAIPDTQSAREMLLRAEPLRIDVVGTDGHAIDTLAPQEGPAADQTETEHGRGTMRGPE